MPANLPPEAMKSLDKASESKKPEDKIKAIEEAISLTPKHKGTEKLVGNMRRKISKLKEEIEKRSSVKKASQKGISKEGAAQVCFLGIENSGKSYLLNLITNKKVNSTPIPFETQKPEIGMYDHQGIKIQFLDFPSITPNLILRKDGPYLMNLIRTTDLVLMTIKENLEEEVKLIEEEFSKNKILFNKEEPEIKITKKGTGGFEFIGEQYLEGDLRHYKKVLQKKKYNSAIIEVFGPITLEEFRRVLDNYSYKKMLVLQDFENAGQKIWDALELIKVYTKEPRKKRTVQPVAMPKGATVKDMAKKIHKDFIEGFKFARVWGDSADFPGQRVGLNHCLMDGDTLQLHT
ncbi:MAG: TGS domain-containing protein [Nanoarchaeota archaeon]|nr:TGS domain-containing protein [Nanoarchaeota archaeon]